MYACMCVRAHNECLMATEQLLRCSGQKVTIATVPYLGVSGCPRTLQAHILHQLCQLFADRPFASLPLAIDTNNYIITEAKYRSGF